MHLVPVGGLSEVLDPPLDGALASWHGRRITSSGFPYNNDYDHSTAVSWALLILVLLALGIALLALSAKRAELRLSYEGLEQRVQAKKKGSHEARLQYPVPDLARCIGCGTCVAACPEEGVLQVVHGQAIVVHGARCVGHGLCAAECPVGAIALTLGDLSDRRDLPAITSEFEAVGTPGLYLAGEITGYALIRTAITHGTAVAAEVAKRKEQTLPNNNTYDLIIVGAGPAGIACALEAKRRGLRAIILEQEQLGGTVAGYPRRKLVMTQPVELPLHGRLNRTTYTKEELMELWESIVREQDIEILTECEFQGYEREADGSFRVTSSHGTLVASALCLALGRRGTPRKLGVPGEQSTKVCYSLIDAQAYTSRKILLVGGGDSAVEAALGLAEQEGNQVTLSYRRPSFNRLKARNEARIAEAVHQGRLECLFDSQVQQIDTQSVALEVKTDGIASLMQLNNDDVFIFAGGTPPFPLLERCGVSLDPVDRPAPAAVTEQGSGLVKVLSLALALGLATLGWTLAFREYYLMQDAQRLDASVHDWLRPGSGAGLALGFLAASFLTVNLCYLARRSSRIPVTWGSLQSWMSVHVLTGVLSLIAAIAHSAMAPKQTVGGHALLCLAILIITGAIGRYFYSFVPHAANGQELKLDEIRARLANMTGEWDQGQRKFAQRVRHDIEALVFQGQWESGCFRRVGQLIIGERRLAVLLRQIARDAEAEGVSKDHLAKILPLARRAYRSALAAAHYEDMRGLIASWRYFHRWVALLMVALVVVHVVTALRFGQISLGGF